MKRCRIIAAGLLTIVLAGGLLVSGAEAGGRQGGRGGQVQGQGLRLRDGSCLNPQSGGGINQPGQRNIGSPNSTRPMDGTGRGYGDGTQPRPLDGTGFGRGATGR